MTVTVTVLYFASARELAGRAEELLEPPEEVRTLRQLAAHLSVRHPRLAGAIGRMRLARNESFAELEDAIEDRDVIALIPPVSGG